MMKLMLNSSRRFYGPTSSPPSSIARFCTVVKDEHSDAPATTRISGKQNRKSLYNRLSALGMTGGSAMETINEYISEGNVTKKYELDTCIWQLRRYGKFLHALQVMEWMQTRHIKFQPTDHAKYLDLISRVRGINAAEDYFNGLPESAKNKCTLGALLNCYCREKLTEKAQTLFKKMDELNIVSSLTFNNLMSLHMRRGMPELVPPLVQEMKERSFQLSVQTYNIWMTSYSDLNDIEGVERVFEEMKVNSGGEQYNWTTYSNLAVAYVKGGLYEKAEIALKKLEAEINTGKSGDREPFHFLISLYCKTSNLDEVYRIWERLKSSFEITTNASTLIMVQSLAKLDDIDGFKKIFEEWQSTCSYYDSRLAKVAIGLYVKHAMIKEAENVFDNSLKRCRSFSYQHCKPLYLHYLETNQLELALRCLEVGISGLKENWYPSDGIAKRFMEYFKKKCNVNSAQKFYAILEMVDGFHSQAYRLLLETYVAAGKTSSEIRCKIINDNYIDSSEVEGLLGELHHG